MFVLCDSEGNVGMFEGECATVLRGVLEGYMRTSDSLVGARRIALPGDDSPVSLKVQHTTRVIRRMIERGREKGRERW